MVLHIQSSMCDGGLSEGLAVTLQEAKCRMLRDAELTEDEAAARTAALGSLRERGVFAQQVASDTQAVDVNFSLLADKVKDDDLAALVDHDDSIAVAVQRDTNVGAERAHGRLQQFGMGRTAA